MAEVLNISSIFSGSLEGTGVQSNMYNFEYDENTCVEFAIYTENRNLYDIDYNFTNFKFVDNINPNIQVDNITVDPEGDLRRNDIIDGNWITEYTILQKKCGTSQQNTLSITEISPSRKEIRLDSSTINDFLLTSETNNFIQERETSTFFRMFYLNPGLGNLLGAVNIALDTSTSNTQVLVKLAEPLPEALGLGTEFTIVELVAEPLTFSVKFPMREIERSDNTELLEGPNLNLVLKDEFSKGTDYRNIVNINNIQASSSLYQIQGLLSSSGININVDYNEFENFIHFSDATIRLENFYYKMSLIESYSSSIVDQSLVSNNSANVQILEDKMKAIITNFDRYENFLYYESGSKSWPKSGSNTTPYINHSTGSQEVIDWIGSYNEQSSNYGGMLLSASTYDIENENNLLYSIPEFIRMNPDNAEYEKFIAMMGEYYDNIWLYTKDITNKLDADNRINFGISRDLVGDALREFGYKIYNNNFSGQDLYNAFLGYDDNTTGGNGHISVGNFLVYGTGLWGDPFIYGPPPSGFQLVTNFVTSSNLPLPLDDINRRVHKRIYHNHPFLAKSKGTKASVRALTKAYGIPDSLIQVSEFSGKDKVSNNDWDFYRPVYNKAISTEINGSNTGSINTAYAVTGSWNQLPQVPRTFEFRFKSDIDPRTLPFEPGISQSLFNLATNPTTDSRGHLFLHYNGSGSVSGSYNGSTYDDEVEYGELVFEYAGPTTNYSASIRLPFFNQGWWNVMLQYDHTNTTFNLYTANNIYHGDNGTKLGWIGSASIDITPSENTRWIDEDQQIWYNVPPTNYNYFTGSFQEIRYWNNLLDVDKWKNHVMNPLSVEGNSLTGTDSPRENLVFRSREGEDISLTGEVNTTYSSIHPKVTGSLIATASFRDSGSLYNVNATYVSNNETQFLNQPIVGIKNRVSDRIRVENLEIVEGNTLSPFTRIQQNNYTSKSFAEGINYIEAGFSPTNQVNDDIISELGGFNIADFIGDPRDTMDRLNDYPSLTALRESYFEKYIKNYNITDFIQLIKNFDNSLFKMIKDLIPIRNTAATGVIIKQNLLERQKYPQPLNTFTDETITGSLLPQSRGFENGTVQVFSGGTAGMVEEFNGLTNRFGVTQSYSESFNTIAGQIVKIHNVQDEFYDGEFSGSNITVTTQSLNSCNPFLNVDITPPTTSSFDLYEYRVGTASLARFDSYQTAPDAGQIYLYNSLTPLESGFRLRRIKVSTFNKEGENIFNKINGANRFTFSFGAVNVIQNYIGSNFIVYSIDHPTGEFPIIPPGVTNVEDVFIDASGDGQVETISIVGPEDDARDTFPLKNYTVVVDSTGLFDNTTGKYKAPYTFNRKAAVTASFDITASLTGMADTEFGGYAYLRTSNNNDDPYVRSQLITLVNGGSGTGEYTARFEYSQSLNELDNPNQEYGLVPLEGQEIWIEFEAIMNDYSSGEPTATLTFNDRQFEVNQEVQVSSGEAILLGWEPYSSVASINEMIDCQPLLNNAIENRQSTNLFDVDYSSNTVLPVNYQSILDRTATKATVPDSNYTAMRSILPRYLGSKLSAAKINQYTYPNGAVLPDGTPWLGDISYGKTPVIEINKTFVSHFQNIIPTSPELEFATQAKIKYHIDIDGDVQIPLVNSPGFYNVEGTYESGDEVDIGLLDSIDSTGGINTNIDTYNTNTSVIKGARRVDAVLTTQVSSLYNLDNPTNFKTESINFLTASGGVTTDYYFQGGLFQERTYAGGTPYYGTRYQVSASNIGANAAGYYDGPTSTWTNTPDLIGITPIKFQYQANIEVYNASAILELVRRRGSSNQILPGATIATITATGGQTKNDRLSFDFDQSATLPALESNMLSIGDLEEGDEVYVSLRIFSSDPNSYVKITDSNFYGRPFVQGGVIVTPGYWTTGSSSPNYLTSSVELGTYHGQTIQLPHSSSEFKPQTNTFTVETGDEFRFEGTEAKTHLVGNVALSGSRVIAEINPPITPGTDLNKFLLRRYVEDGTSVLLGFNPTNVQSLIGSKGFLKTTTLNLEEEATFTQILTDLTKDGTIS